MNKKIICIVVLILTVSVGIGVVWSRIGREGTKENKAENETTEDSSRMKKEDDTASSTVNTLVKREDGDIIWTISDDVKVNEKYLELFNEKLKSEGLNCRLKFQYLNADSYEDEVEEVLRNGDTDIVLGGQSTQENPNPVEYLSEKGLLLCLDDYLDSTEGKTLKEEYENALWGSVKIDGHIYTIPNGIYDDGRQCVVFNNKYVDKEKSSKFNGDLSNLENYISEDIIKNPAGKEIIWTWDAAELARVMGYYEKYGLFFDAETGEVKTPYDCGNINKLFDMLYKLNQKKCICKEDTFLENEEYKKIRDKIEKKEFSILLTKETEDIRKLKSEMTVVPLDFVVNFGRTGGTNGICASSKNKDRALQILSMLHTDDAAAHLLLYGKEGEDYKLNDGRVVTENGPMIELIDILGIFRSTYPSSDEDVFTGNIRQRKKEVYRSKQCKISVLSGFQIDEGALSQEEIMSGEKILKNMDIWKLSNYQDKYEEVARESKKMTDSLQKKIEKQKKAWEKKTKQAGGI